MDNLEALANSYSLWPLTDEHDELRYGSHFSHIAICSFILEAWLVRHSLFQWPKGCWSFIFIFQGSTSSARFPKEAHEVKNVATTISTDCTVACSQRHCM